MKKLILFFLLTTSFSFSQKQLPYHNPNFDLYSGQNYYIFGDNVKFRQLPNIKSKVIELLKIGTEIQVIHRTPGKLNYNGIESSFYKVKYKEKIGYILGGLISLEKKEFNNSTYLFNYKKTDDNYDNYAIIIRHLNNKSNFTEVISDLETYEFSIDIFNNKGIEGIENILFINYFVQSCGYNGGGIFFFQTENGLKKVFETTIASDGDEYSLKENLIFPTDEKGIKGKIVYQKEISNYKSSKTKWIELNKISRELLKWENGELIPKKIVPKKQDYIIRDDCF